MKDASQYPITFGYKAIDMPWYGPGGTIGPYHRGEDRAMPDGTPVIVNGVTIGLSNNTGATTGSHLHIGRFVGANDTPPNGGGFSFSSAVVYDTGNDPTNGNYVRITGDGALWNYLHLESILVTKGQVLKGTTMPQEQDVIDYFKYYNQGTPTPQQITYYTTRSWQTLASDIADSLLEALQAAEKSAAVNKASVLAYVNKNLQ